MDKPSKTGSPDKPSDAGFSDEPKLRGVDFNASRFLRVVGQANIELFAGTLDAFSAGARAFSESLTDENVTQVGFRNGFVTGAFQSWERGLGDLQETWKRAFVILQPKSGSDSSSGG